MIECLLFPNPKQLSHLFSAQLCTQKKFLCAILKIHDKIELMALIVKPHPCLHSIDVRTLKSKVVLSMQPIYK